MSKLINLSELNVENFINLLRDEEIIIYENISGSKIFFRFNDTQLIIKTKNIDNQPLNKIDFALQKFYDKAIQHLENLDYRIKKLCPDTHWFICEYFPDNLQYDTTPKNNLILTAIIKNKEFTSNIDEILEFSNLLNIDMLPILFYGKLVPKQIEIINNFLHVKKEDLEYIFGDDNFASFFYKILNPNFEKSFLMQDTFMENLDKFIIKFKDSQLSLTLLNPLYDKSEDKNTNYYEVYSILVCDFLEYLNTIDLDRRFISGDKADDIYINLMCEVFNKYISEREDRISKFEFDIPSFYQDDIFKLNLDLITNKTTSIILNRSTKNQYIFKILLSSFRYKKKKENGIINTDILKMFNNQIDKINKIIDRTLRIESEEALKKSDLLDFEKFFDIKYPKPDASGTFHFNVPEPEEVFNQKKKPKKV